MSHCVNTGLQHDAVTSGAELLLLLHAQVFTATSRGQSQRGGAAQHPATLLGDRRTPLEP